VWHLQECFEKGFTVKEFGGEIEDHGVFYDEETNFLVGTYVCFGM
jgi:hypothetical protein